MIGTIYKILTLSIHAIGIAFRTSWWEERLRCYRELKLKLDCDKPGERTHSISQGTAEEPFSLAHYTSGKEAPSTPDAPVIPPHVESVWDKLVDSAVSKESSKTCSSPLNTSVRCGTEQGVGSNFSTFMVVNMTTPKWTPSASNYCCTLPTLRVADTIWLYFRSLPGPELERLVL